MLTTAAGKGSSRVTARRTCTIRFGGSLTGWPTSVALVNMSASSNGICSGVARPLATRRLAISS